MNAKNIYRICLALAPLWLWAEALVAQVQITTRVLPPYQSRITEYMSRPELMLVTMTNTTATERQIQLTARITGDNGMAAWVKPGYRSPSPIVLGPNQTISLNGSSIAQLFDVNTIEFTGVSRADMNRGLGLPEGNYTLCIQALDYSSLAPLSPDEPIGCALFRISDLEPPRILMPIDKQTIAYKGVQALPMTWSTPPGSAPHIQYKVKIVEMVFPRDPNDALQSTPPIYEETVPGNSLLYGPAHPPLIVGRQYAMIVQAVDPSGLSFFRNRGMSEAIAFTYGSEEQQHGLVIAKADGRRDTLKRDPIVIRGRLLYQFGDSKETGTFPLANQEVYLEKAFYDGHPWPESTDDTEKEDGKLYQEARLPQQNSGLPEAYDAFGGVLAKTDDNGYFELHTGITSLDSAGILGQDQLNLFEIRTRGDRSTVRMTYKLNVVNPHFKTYHEDIDIVPQDSLFLRDVVLDAKSYTLAIDVRESFNGIKGAAVEGAEVKLYRTLADKLNQNLMIPYYEGDLLEEQATWPQEGDKILVAAGTTAIRGNRAIAFLPRLFANPIGADGNYQLCLVQGEQVVASSSFGGATNYYEQLTEGIAHVATTNEPSRNRNDEGEWENTWSSWSYIGHKDTVSHTLEKQRVVPPRSRVTGTLKYAFKYHPNLPSQPYANMRVSLRSSEYLDYEDSRGVLAMTTTDAEGRFTFDFENVDSTYRRKISAKAGRRVTLEKRVYHVVPEVPYYAAPDFEVLVQPWGDFDCGELVSQVRTFTFNLSVVGDAHVVDANGNVTKADPLPDAIVSVLRHDDTGGADPQLPKFPNMPGMDENTRVNVKDEQEFGTEGPPYLMKRRVKTGQNGKVSIRGLIPAYWESHVVSAEDQYVVILNSDDRSSSSANYIPTSFTLPHVMPEHIPAPSQQGSAWQPKGPEGGAQFLDRGAMVQDMWLDTRGHAALFDDRTKTLLQTGPSLQSVVQGVGTVAHGKVVQDIVRTGGGAIGRSFRFQPAWLAEFGAYLHTEKEKNVDRLTATSSNQAEVRFRVTGMLIPPGGRIRFNSDLPAQEEEVNSQRHMKRRAIRIAGRVIDGASTLGVEGAAVEAYWLNQQGISNQIRVQTNANGDFIMPTDNRMTGRSITLAIRKPGYEYTSRQIGVMETGMQFYDEQLKLEPVGRNMYGLVVDVDDTTRAVPARIKVLDNGIWKNTRSFSGSLQTHFQAIHNEIKHMEVENQQLFHIDLAGGVAGQYKDIQVIVMPFDRAYMTDTLILRVNRYAKYLGRIKLTPRQHKVEVYVSLSEALQHGELPVPTEVTLLETGHRDTIHDGTNGRAYFEFVNNATKDFTLHVKPLRNETQPDRVLFVPTTTTFSSEDDGQVEVVYVNVDRARLVSGNVRFASSGQPAVGAKVYPEDGQGNASSNHALTDENGDYQLALPDMAGLDEIPIKAGYFEEGRTLLSDIRIVTRDAHDAIDLTISEFSDLDISRLYGFKTQIDVVQPLGDGQYLITGELYDLEKSQNFDLRNRELGLNLKFSELKVRASTTLTNDRGIPIAIPAEGEIITDNRSFAVRVNDTYNGTMMGTGGQQSQWIKIERGAADNAGQVTAKVRLLDNSFAFPSSYMTMQSTDLYLGTQALAHEMPVFVSNGADYRPVERFALSNAAGQAIRFKYLGFSGRTEVSGDRAAFLQGNTISLFMNLNTTLPGNIPLNVQAGKVEITDIGVGRILTTDDLRFDLDEWAVRADKATGSRQAQTPTPQVAPSAGYLAPGGYTPEVPAHGLSHTWELSPESGGLVIKKGEIITSKLNIPFRNMTIIPNEEGFPGDLVCDDLLGGNAIHNIRLMLGDVTPLTINPDNPDKPVFIFDPGVGSLGNGNYKFALRTISSSGTAYAASFTGLDGMTDANQSFKVQIVSLLSNGEELFGFTPGQQIIYYNQLRFTPLTLSVGSDNSLTLNGNIDLRLPHLNDSYYLPLVYRKVGQGNQVTMPVFGFSFTGPGNTKFTVRGSREAQLYHNYGFAFAGRLDFPEGGSVDGAKLLSMVTSGGGGSSVEREVDVLFGAQQHLRAYFEEQGQPLGTVFQQAKDALIGKLDDYVADFATKSLDIGTGDLTEFAGAWKLGQQAAGVWKTGGQLLGTFDEALKAANQGDYLRMAGMVKNLPGMSEAIQTVENRMKLLANNALNAAQKELPLPDGMTEIGGDGSFLKDAELEFDFSGGRIYGSLQFKRLELGALSLSDGGMEMLFERKGWYFYTGAQLDIPSLNPFLPVKVGMLMGVYGEIDHTLEGKVTRTSVSKKLPSAVKSGLNGFFITGGKPLADLDIGFGIPPIAEFKLVAAAGLEVRTYAVFNTGKFKMGLGALAYGRVFAKASALGVSVSGGAEVNVGIATAFEGSPRGVAACIEGCASINFMVEACAFGICDTRSSGLTALVKVGVSSASGAAIGNCPAKGMDVSLSFSKESCANNPDFNF